MKKLAALTLSLFLTTGTALADSSKNANPEPAKAAEPAKPKAAKNADKSDSEIAAQLETAGLVLRMDPFRPQIAAAQRDLGVDLQHILRVLNGYEHRLDDHGARLAGCDHRLEDHGTRLTAVETRVAQFGNHAAPAETK